jgi:hypothetical protein
MAIAYTWICHFCGGSNAPGTDACTRCGKPSIASANDIAGAKEHKPESTSQELPPHKLPVGAKVILGILMGIAVAGAVLERFAWSMGIEILAVALMVGGGLPAWLIFKWYQTRLQAKIDPAK